MKLIDSVQRMSTLARMIKREGKAIGLVPTMGYLHDGHISLVRAARKHTDFVVMSIFINPLQFGPKEDFDKYPRDFKHDERMAMEAGVDVIFFPYVKDMYPDNFSTFIEVEGLENRLCGRSRQDHFKGVTTVVAKLLNIVKPDISYFGQKDAQQAIIIAKMVRDLNMDTELKIMPIARERDGLAMSSRNVYLSEAERREAPSLYRALKKAQESVKSGERDAFRIKKLVSDIIEDCKLARIDYVDIVDTLNLESIDTVNEEALLALAVYFGKTRLIDNVILKV